MPTKISIPQDSTIFNPLEALASTSGFKAEAAVQNMISGMCPKCHKTMTTAKVANGDDVHWCANCCVASPMPDYQAG